MINNEYDRIIRENFDLSDNYTRRYIASLHEDAQQEQLLHALSLALYESIVAKVDEIDFGTIPLSRGDITKVEGFNGTVECLNIMRQLVLEYKQNPAVVDVVLTAIENVKERKSLFIKGYALDAEFPMLMYNLIVLCIERATSLMIATCIQFIKDPASTTPKKALYTVAYKKTMEDVMFKQLMCFNNLCKNKEFDKMLDTSMKPIKENTEIDMDGNIVTPITDEIPSNQEVPSANDDTTPFEDMPDESPFGDGPLPSMPSDECGDDCCGVTIAVPQQEDDNPMSGAELSQDTTKVPDNNPTVPQDEENDPMVGAQMTSAPYQSAGDTEKVDLTVTPNQINNDTEEEEIDLASIPSNDDVEPENIPSVNPGDAISSTDAPINEDDGEEESDPVPEDSVLEATAAEVAAGFLDAMKKLGNVKQDTKLSDLPKASKGVKIAFGVVSALGIAAMLFKAKNLVIEFLRKGIYTFYYSKAKFADYLAVQADLLEANANELEISTNSGLDEETKERAIKKQRATAEKLRKWSNKFEIDKKQTENQVDKATKEDEKNRKRIDKDEDGDDALF